VGLTADLRGTNVGEKDVVEEGSLRTRWIAEGGGIMRIRNSVSWVGVAGLSLVASLASGCFFLWDDRSDEWSEPYYDCGGYYYDWCGSASPGTQTEEIADIETNGTMTIAPGEGVGVFIEYEKGGVWRVRTTCDSKLDGYRSPCYFQVSATVSGGSASSLVLGSSSYEGWATARGNALDYSGWIYDGVGGMVFSASAGATVQFKVLLDSLPEARFTYWMGNDALHYGAPSNPIHLRPTVP